MRDCMDTDGGIGKHDDRLHERIRELEAELARTRADSMKWDVIQKGKEKEQYDRAERGWERVEELAKKLGDEKARAEKAEARVAELEEEVKWLSGEKVVRMQARAEKAEAELEEMGQRSDIHLDKWKAAKARVAELEARLASYEDPRQVHWDREREAE